MQALAGIGVVAVGVDDDDVALGQSAQRDPGRLVISRDVQVLVVEAGAAHGVGGDVDDRVGAGSASNTTVVVDRKVRSPGAPLPSVTSRMIW